jgi:hypothetical protein
VVVGPGVLEPLSQQFDGVGAAAGQDEKACRGCTESTDYPKNIFHCNDSSSPILLDLPAMRLVGWMRRSCEAFVQVVATENAKKSDVD